MSNHDMQGNISDIVSSTEIDVKFCDDQIDLFNNKILGLDEDKNPIANHFAIKDKNITLAGINSWVYFDKVVYVSVLFVNESYRDKGLGSRLLEKVETQAKAMGATLAHLDTFDFQAKDFYLKHGYTVFGVLENCPKGHQRYYMSKAL